MRSRSTSGRAVLRTVDPGVPWGSNARANVTTPRLSLNKPEVGGDIDVWGDLLNSNMDVLDQSLLLAGGTMAGQLRGYAGTAANPAFSTANGVGIYPIGGTILGIAASSSNVWMFALSGNQSLVALSMNNNRVQGVGTPIVAGDAVNLGFLQSTQGDYLPLTGSPPAMEGRLDMGGNLLTGLAIPQNPADATSKQYVDALVADLRLFMGTWSVAANVPDISDTSSITAGDYYIATTVDPTVPETAGANIPGIAGQSVHNGDMVIFDENDSIWELVRGGPLTVAEADELFVSKGGDTMSGGLSVPALTVLGPGVHGITYAGAGATGSNIAFAAQGNQLSFFVNGIAQDYLVGRSGTTMTGPLILAGDATDGLGAATLEQVLAIAGNYLPLVGGGLSGGLNFGSEVASGPGDLSRHISLFGGSQYGFGITGNRLNYNSQFNHVFRSAGNDIAQVSATGLSMISGDVILLRPPTEPNMAASKAYVDAHEGGGGPGGGIEEAPENDTGYVRYNASWLNADTRYLPRDGGGMFGPINMNANLIYGLPPPQAATDATNKEYVDALISDLKLFIGTWKVALNSPDISAGATDGDYYIAVTADPTVPETAPPNIPGVGGLLIHNGDMVIWAAAVSEWELVPGSPLTVADAEMLFVSKAGDTMEGPLILADDAAEALGAVPLQQLQGIVGNYLPTAGGTITGALGIDQYLNVQGDVWTGGYLTVTTGLNVAGGGINCGGAGVTYTGIGEGWANNRIAFGWNGSSIMTAVDGSYHGAIATTEFVAANYLWLGGGTISGGLTVGDFNSNGNVRSSAGGFYAHGGDSRMTLRGDGAWEWVTNGAWLATVDAGGNFTIPGQMQSNTVVANGVTSNGNLTVANDTYSRNLFAYTNGPWQGSYLGVGANWDFSWRLTVDGDTAALIITRSDTGATVSIDGGGSLYAPRLASGECAMSGNTFSAPYVNVVQNMNAGGEVVGFQLWAGPAGIVSASDYTVKPSGGMWGTLLDERLVDDRGGYEMGLGEVLRLRPIRYTLKDRISIKGHAFGSAEEHVGLVAQEAEAVMPGMVSKITASLNDTEMDDLRMLDASQLLYALVNALKEIDARLRALEGGRHVQ